MIGILGGMGPWATLDLFRRILELTPAARDQEHLHIVIENNPSVPDRTAAILGRGESPLPALVEGATRLVQAGVDFMVMPCNTAHYWIRELSEAVPVPVLDMVAETVAAALAWKPGLRHVGLLATTGTIQGGMYRRRFARRRVQVLVPDDEAQRTLVMEAIFGRAGIKAGRPGRANRRRLVQAAQALVDAGAQALIAACTEISLVLRPEDVTVPLVDTLDCLARAAVKRACGGVDFSSPDRRKEHREHGKGKCHHRGRHRQQGAAGGHPG